MNLIKRSPAARKRRITTRTYGKNHGPTTRLMSPSDLGEILKPFVFLDLFHHEGEPFSAPLHPHSGIATLTYVAEGAVSYIDPDNVKGTLAAGGVEWMQAGRGMWHGGGLDKAGRTRGFQLWVAIASGVLSAPNELRHGDLAAFEPSSEAVAFEARTDAEFVLGSAVPHKQDLVLGTHSVHTTPVALRDAQAHISAIRTHLVQEGRL